MRAAAHTPGGYGGVPQAVGKEFVNADLKDEAGPALCAGIVLFAGPKLLMLKRPDGSWDFPGGHAEDGEDAFAAALRECREETGIDLAGSSITELARRVTSAVDYTNFVARLEGEPAITLQAEEHEGYAWMLPAEALTLPLHDGVGVALAKITGTELDVARLIRDGELVSPQRFENMWLFAIRITGTGAAYRTTDKQFTWRDPSIYLNDEFLARCNGLPVLWEHPEETMLNSEEFADRIIGAVMLPYIKDQDVWGIARIYDDDAVKIMLSKTMSTSPGVILASNSSSTATLDGFGKILIEGNPKLNDHIAVVDMGVWDKAGDPKGISSMAEEHEGEAKTELEKVDAAKFDAFCAKMDAFMDSVSKRFKDEDDAKAEREAKDKKDGVEDRGQVDEEKEKAERLAADKAKRDAAAFEEIQTKIKDLDERMPRELEDAEKEEIADAQEKCDRVTSAFGERPLKPYVGERAIAYRQRAAARFQKHSADWKDVDLSKLDSAALGVAERTIFADALRVSDEPVDLEGGLQEVVTRTNTGHTVTTFRGSIRDTFSDFRAPGRKTRGVRQ